MSSPDNTWGAPAPDAVPIVNTADFTWGGNSGIQAADGGDDGAYGQTGEYDGNAGGDACFNCGKPGHMKSDCPNPRVFSGTCRRCNEEGHMSKDCPQPLICKNCGEQDHHASECKGARKVDRSDLPEMLATAAWEKLAKAVVEHDIDDVKEAVQIYIKASPEITYGDLEEAFRGQNMGIWLIAIEKPHLAATLTNMDLQGNLEKKYTVTYRFDPNPPRPREREVWPQSAEENMERLKDAGEVVNRGISKCRNCDELGHIFKNCPQEKQEPQGVVNIMCYNCDGEGHRVRDCPVPRVDKFACKNCGKSGHKVADCPEPRSAADVECRKCNEIGHFSRDCPTAGPRGCRNCGVEGHFAKDCTEPRNMANVQCRNCDEFGHTGKECPKPRDISRVKCSHCQEMGHFKSKCPNPIKDEDAEEDSGNMNGGTAEFDTNGGGDGEAWGANPASAVDVNNAW